MKKPPAKPASKKQMVNVPGKPPAGGLWWKLPLATLPLMLVLGVFAQAVWSRVERNRVEQRLVPLRAAGMPTEPKDLVEPKLSDDANLAVAIRAATAARPNDRAYENQRQTLTNDEPNAFALPLTDAEAAFIRETMVSNAGALEALAAVDGRHEAAWGLYPPTTPLINILLPQLREGRTLVMILNDVARLAAHERRWADAFQAIGRMEPLAEAAAANKFLIGTLVAYGTRSTASGLAIDIAPDVAATDAATRARVEAMIRALLDDAATTRECRDGLIYERVMCREMLAMMRRGHINIANAGGVGAPSVGGRIIGLLATPPLYRGEGIAIDLFDEHLRVADAPSQVAADAGMSRATSLFDDMRNGKLTLIASTVVPSMQQYHAAKFRCLTDRHLAATALALRLYQLDHNDERPATLDALVPAYLPTLPIDAIDGKPLRYDPKRAIVWSVGENRTDDGGDETAPKRSGVGLNRWSSKDAVVHLTRQPRPSTQPTE